MADVQLEHGHVRITNRLYEAALHAPFRESHLRIVLALIRVTYGWGQKAVRLPSEAQLARYARLEPHGGGFRLALRELAANGVVRKSVDGTLGLQKNYERWGEYSVAEARIESLFSDRPDVGNIVEVAPTQAHLGTETPESHAPRQAQPAPRQAQPAPRQAQRGVVTDVVSPLTTSERQERQERHTAASGESALTDASMDTGADPVAILTRAANEGITHRYGEQPSPLRPDAETSLLAVDELAHAGVPTPFARDAILELAKRCKLTRPPKSLRYFVPAAVEKWELASRPRAAAPRDQRSDGALIFARIRDLITETQQPGQAPRRFIPLKAVEAMGPEVLRAYKAVGGADVILSTPPEKLTFLIRDFSQALEAARASA